MPDGRPTISGQSLHSVALSYGTLPRAPRRAPASASNSSHLRPGASPAPPPGPESLYATLSRPPRSASHRRQPSLPSSINGLSGHAPHHGPPQPRRLDVPPEADWRGVVGYRTAPPTSACDPHTPCHQQPPRARPRRDPHLCSLCQQLPAEPPRPFCPPCSAYVARFQPAS